MITVLYTDEAGAKHLLVTVDSCSGTSGLVNWQHLQVGNQ